MRMSMKSCILIFISVILVVLTGMQEQRENGKVTNDFSSCGSFSSTSFKTFALFAEASATNDDEKPPTNETRPSDKVTEVGLRRRVEENVFA